MWSSKSETIGHRPSVNRSSTDTIVRGIRSPSNLSSRDSCDVRLTCQTNKVGRLANVELTHGNPAVSPTPRCKNSAKGRGRIGFHGPWPDPDLNFRPGVPVGRLTDWSISICLDELESSGMMVESDCVPMGKMMLELKC